VVVNLSLIVMTVNKNGYGLKLQFADIQQHYLINKTALGE
jgi:hypothetical protein